MFVVNYLRSFFSSSEPSPSDRGGGVHVRERISFWTLNVTVVRTTNKTSMTPSDLFVTLRLPTATTRTYCTQTVSDEDRPQWKHGSFTFRIPIQVKNILEISLFDADPSHNEPIYTGYLDVSVLLVGERETRTFTTNQQTNHELVMDFELIKSDEVNDAYCSNGVIVTAPITALDIGVEKLLNNFSVDDKLLNVVGSYQGTLDVTESETLCFYINGDLETELGLIPKDGAEGASPAHMETSVRLDPLRADHSGKVSLEVGEDVVDLDVDTNEYPDVEPSVRIDFDIPPEEKAFLTKRKVVVTEALQKLFRCGLKPEQVPTIAVVASGGGSRAMTGLLGGLRALKDMGVLDAVTYITGVSGSTWTMSALYQDTNWSNKDMNSFITAEKVQVIKGTRSAFTPEKIRYYHEELTAKDAEGHAVSFSDVAALVFEHLIFGKKMTGTLSEQRNSVGDGQNPFPIYTAINVKQDFHESEWCEFTPYEVGLLKYGTFVPTEDFGSHFFLGHRLEKLPELRLPYLIGIWSGASAVNVTEEWKSATEMDPPWSSHGEESDEPPRADVTTMTLVPNMADRLSRFLSSRVGATHISNFMRGFFFRWDYSKHPNFTARKDEHSDTFPNQLTPSDSTLELVDSGHVISVGCAPVLRPERNVDIIIVLSYSCDQDHVLNVIERTAEYCQGHQVPFPNVDFSRMEEKPEEIYVFEDEKNPRAPVVIHFPLVNITYREFIRPGVKRETEEEIQAGDVDVRSETSPFGTVDLNYTEQDYDFLVNLAYYNVINNTERVHTVIWKVVQGKMNQPEGDWCNLQ